MSCRPHAEFTLNELVVLSLLKEREMFGSEIIRIAAATTSASRANAGTIYPLLKDLARNGWLSCRHATRPSRTYYRLTDPGRDRLMLIATRWGEIHGSVSELLTGVPAPEGGTQPARRPL